MRKPTVPDLTYPVTLLILRTPSRNWNPQYATRGRHLGFCALWAECFVWSLVHRYSLSQELVKKPGLSDRRQSAYLRGASPEVTALILRRSDLYHRVEPRSRH